MGLIKKLFSSPKNNIKQVAIEWLALEQVEQLAELIDQSTQKYQAIFKHSTRCGVSGAVLRQFEKQTQVDEVDFYLLDLLKYRALSDEIAKRFEVWHESPQLIVLKNKKVIAHASHYEIMRISLD